MTTAFLLWGTIFGTAMLFLAFRRLVDKGIPKRKKKEPLPPPPPTRTELLMAGRDDYEEQDALTGQLGLSYDEQVLLQKELHRRYLQKINEMMQ